MRGRGCSHPLSEERFLRSPAVASWKTKQEKALKLEQSNGGFGQEEGLDVTTTSPARLCNAPQVAARTLR